jgi:hypothetical protein
MRHGRDVDWRASDDVRQHAVDRRKREPEAERAQHGRIHPLAAEQDNRCFAEDGFEDERGHRQHGRPPKRPSESAREFLHGDPGRSDGVDGSSEPFIDDGGGEDRHEVVQVDPRQALAPGAHRIAKAHPKRRQHLRERAAVPAEDDARRIRTTRTPCCSAPAAAASQSWQSDTRKSPPGAARSSSSSSARSP